MSISTFAAQFLSRPRPSTDHISWGDKDVKLELAAIRFSFSGLNENQIATVLRLYSSSILHDTVAPHIRIDLYRLSPDSFRLFDRSGWVYDMSFEFSPDHIWVAGWGFVGNILLRPQIQASVWTCLDLSDEFQSVFENFFRVVLAYALVQKGGLLLHSAGVVYGETAHLFFGPSNAGKSTVCGIGADAGLRVLSDDLNAVFPRESFLEAEKLPFAGETRFRSSSTGTYKVSGFYKLNKHSRGNIRDLNPASAIAALYGSAPFVNTNPFLFDRLISITTDLLVIQPVKELFFRRDSNFEELIRGHE